jgi:hypothetical protein
MKLASNIHKQSGMAVEYILKNSLLRRTLDNVTVVMIAFSNFKHAVFGESKASAAKDDVNTRESSVGERDFESVNRKKENIPPFKN